MMEYEDFLKELKDCYEAHGHDFWRAVFCFCYSNKGNKSGLGKFDNKFAYQGIKSNLHVNAVLDNPSAQKKIDSKKEATEVFKSRKSFAPANKHWGVGIGTFMDVKDVVYSLAWELSQKIGRLPDHIHARMSLSIDRHPSVSRYIERFGA
jgi:hypothetical protein